VASVLSKVTCPHFVTPHTPPDSSLRRQEAIGVFIDLRCEWLPRFLLILISFFGIIWRYNKPHMSDDQGVATGGSARQDDTTVRTVVDGSSLNIPEETRAQFPKLIPLIEKSPSMNDEERQYWIDVLPIMTEDQLTNLNEILGNEKTQIDEANKVYSDGVKKAENQVKSAFDEGLYKAKKKARIVAETQHETEERAHEEALLKEIATM
jgi:hypothetical protein